MRIKTKLNIGTWFLFIVILVFGILSLVSVNRLKTDAGKILKNNYETLVYDNAMLDALDTLHINRAYVGVFQRNLDKQSANITEVGEKKATEELRRNFLLMRSDLSNDSLKRNIRQSIHDINDINQQAIFQKNERAVRTAETANAWLLAIFTVLILVTFTMVVNFPGFISRPIITFNEGIRAIVNKDYSKRIHLKQKDEFGELASAFNTMADKLDQYENSNLAKIMFEKSRIETIISQMNDGIIGLDEKKNVLFINGVAQQLIGLKEVDIAGNNADVLASRNDLMKTLLQEKQSSHALKIFADNKESYFGVESLTVQNDGRTIGEVIILRNVTAFHELDEAKTNFIATVSHELKTPIAAIKISTELLNDQRVGHVNAEQQDLVNSIQDDADRLLKITSELLTMSQVETGHIELNLEAVPCREIAAEALTAVEFMLKQKDIPLRQDIMAGLPPVLADKEKTSWVLINFLTNAVKHSPPGSEITLRMYGDQGEIRFEVTDHGAGMEAKYLPRIFDRYFKIPASSQVPGTGLGLSIAKQFIDAQSGNVWVESEPGIGSTFGFALPASGVANGTPISSPS